jgi:high affinity sulfate transporter 1
MVNLHRSDDSNSKLYDCRPQREESHSMSLPSLARWIPSLDWLRTYDGRLLRGDIVASITLAAYLLPAALGDASLARLPPQAGLYACLFGGLVFWIFCGSRYTAVSVTSAISLVIGSSLGEITGGNTARFGALAAGTALFVSLIAFIAWLTKAGVFVHFISESVMTGFKCGVALFLASTQLPKLFGFHGAHGSFWENAGFFFKHLNETNSISLLVGASALALLILGKIFFKHKPVALLVVIGGIIAASAFSLEARGVNLIGAVPQGIPPLKAPALYWRDLNELLPLALACFLLGAVETAAIGRMFAAKCGARFDANQENLALAASNLFAGLGGGFPVSGGTSQSLVNEEAGATTPLSTGFAAVFILVVVLFFSHLLSALPQPVLAAVVLVAIAGLLNLSILKALWLDDRSEFVVAMAAFAGVLTFGLLLGVMLGSLISLVQLVRISSRPHVALLGRIPGTRRFSDRDRHGDNELIPDVMIFRPESTLVYFNVDNICEAILSRVRVEAARPKLVVLDLSAAPIVDMQSAHTLASMADELTAMSIQFHAVEPRSSVRDRLRREGVDIKLGGVNRFTSVADVIDHFLSESEPSVTATKSSL